MRTEQTVLFDTAAVRAPLAGTAAGLPRPGRVPQPTRSSPPVPPSSIPMDWCPWCRTSTWWRSQTGVWTCVQCHPAVTPDVVVEYAQGLAFDPTLAWFAGCPRLALRKLRSAADFGSGVK
jgi:hypothetical protein